MNAELKWHKFYKVLNQTEGKMSLKVLSVALWLREIHKKKIIRSAKILKPVDRNITTIFF